MNMLPGRVRLTALAAALLALAVIAGGAQRAAAQITGLAVDNTQSSGSVSNGTGQNVCTTSAGGTIAPLGGNTGESRNQVTVPSSSPTSFTTRFVADLCTDSGGSTISATVSTYSCTAGGNTQSMVANYTSNFNVNAPTGTTYRLTVTNQLAGMVDIFNDGGGAATGTMSAVTTSESGGTLFGGGNLNLSNGLPLSVTAGNTPVTNPAQLKTTVYTGTGSGGPNAHSINSTWNAGCSTPSNGQECGIRIGLTCSTNGAALIGDTSQTAGKYPGSPTRDQATDGQFVSVALEFCGDGIVQQDGVIVEQCDNGLDPVTGNGGSASCCTTNCQVKTTGTTCRPVGGECDVADVCDGVSPICGTDFKKASGTACTDDLNPCSSDMCNGVSNACQHPAGNAGALCRASADPDCDPAELCTGTSTACPGDTHQPDGFLCTSDGIPCTSDICTNGMCTHPASNAGTVCRAATDVCDVADVCDGTSTACGADNVQPEGTACPDDGKLCTSDRCDGTSKACQHTGILTQGTVCRAAVSVCDVDEVCDGTSPDCPPDVVETRQINCRDLKGPCDLEEYCTGTNPQCPPDGKVPANTICRPQVGGAEGVCDVAETCDGVTDDCPADGVAAAGTICRDVASDPQDPSIGACDVAETCDGTLKTCPADGLASSQVVCRDAQGVCDAVEYCTGTYANCPFDQKDPNFSECRPVTPPGNVCDVPEFCSGTDNDCPPDQFGPSSNICRPSAGNCDVDEYCTGTSGVCPVDRFQASSLVCRSVAGICDVEERCTGTAAACPPDAFATTLCRADDGSGCDVADFCSGTSPDCPPDAKEPDGFLCVGPDPNTCLNACVTGVCTDACPGGNGNANTPGCPRPGTLYVPNCCGNGIIDGDEQCDDGNQLSGGDACPSLPGDNCQITGNGGLIRGDVYNPATRDINGCQVEFSVQKPPLDLDRFGQPARIQICDDQDPACDLDPTPGRCLFHVAVCLANTDPNLPLCTPDGINSLKVNTRPYLRKSSPQVQFVGANNAKFQQAINALFNPAQPALGFSNAPPLTPDQHDMCSGGFLVEVYAASAGRVRQSLVAAQRFRVKSKDQHSPRHRTDNSTLILVCRARPLP